MVHENQKQFESEDSLLCYFWSTIFFMFIKFAGSLMLNFCSAVFIMLDMLEHQQSLLEQRSC